MLPPDFRDRLATRFPALAAAAFWVRYGSSTAWRRSLRPQLDALRHLRMTTPEPLAAAEAGPRTVLLVGFGDVATSVLERVMLAGFERAGYAPAVLISHAWPQRQAYRWLGIDRLLSPAAFGSPAPTGAAESFATFFNSQRDVLAFQVEGVRVGTYAAATIMRMTRSGRLDLADTHMRGRIAGALDDSLDALEQARALMADLRPDAVLLAENAYTPFGELFDLAILSDVPVFLWNTNQTPGTISMKRFHAGNATEHPYSLSPESWERAQAMEWTDAHERRLFAAMDGGYESGQWFSSVGTQVGTRAYDREALSARLALDPGKKTALLFPHMFWDATFAWGDDLFEDYEDWFCRVLRAAADNDALNWVIKVHPANRVKSARDGIAGASSESMAIRRELGDMPAHIHLIEPETDISTASVFALGDYCLTVRGTVGIEAACRGICTLTAGTGRYDRRGFTRDFDQIDTYLTALSQLQELPPMTEQEIRLARRYAYAAFIARALPLDSLAFAFRTDATATMDARLLSADRNALLDAPDVRRIGDWIAGGGDDLTLDEAF